MAQVFHGTIVHSTSPSSLHILPSALLAVESSRITLFVPDVTRNAVQSALSAANIASHNVTYLSHGQFLMPGFIDTHNHAPQWLHRGQGQGLHILEWLDQVAFHHESLFADASHAKRVFSSVVSGMLRQGVTTASYYSSRHCEATKILADTCLSKGQRALVGKCNMARNAPDWYRDDDNDSSLRETADAIAYIRSLDPSGTLLRPVLTPRFAICCDADLLSGLGDLAKDGTAIQTHFNESQQEKDFTLSLFPKFTNEADLYEHYGLLTPASILAHCTIMSDYETQRLADLRCGVAHCPTANMTVGGGFMAAPVAEFLRKGIKVGLGTDSGGGYSTSMLNAMRHSMITSFARDYLDKGDGAVSFEQVFYMATLGGAQVVSQDCEIGSFATGKQFDALVVDLRADRNGVNAPVEDNDSPRTVLEKFVMTGDDRNIERVYVAGRLVKS